MAARLLALFLALMSLGQGTLTQYEEEMSLGGTLFLVNRDFVLASDYKPEDLVVPDVRLTYPDTTMRAEAAGALEEMFAAAKEEAGHTLIGVSGFRSYGQQASIYERKIKNAGKKQAMLLVAPPGASEHQLGLAMDLGTPQNQKLNQAFGDTQAGAWVRENCHRFGFIIRYKAEWTEITGYADEPWHVRYVGKEHAQRIFEMNIPLEYYIDTLRQVQYDGLTEQKR